MRYRRLALILALPLLSLGCDRAVPESSVPPGAIGAQRAELPVNNVTNVGSTSSGSSTTTGCTPGCSSASDCQNQYGSPGTCHVWYCTGACKSCLKGTAVSGTACDDGNACTYGDACSSGSCVGTSISCVSDACASRICNGTSSCTVTPINEGAFCNTSDKCQHPNTCHGGVCQTNPATVCTQAECHTTPTCDPSTGTCSSNPVTGGSCGGDQCSNAGTCAAGICNGGSAKDCSSMNGPCTVGVCDPTAGCVAQPKPNGTDCSTDKCHPGMCTNGTCVVSPVTCAECQACDPTSGSCMPAAGGACATGDPCKTNGTCNASGGCDESPFPDGTPCVANCGTGECVSGACVCGGSDDMGPAGGADDLAPSDGPSTGQPKGGCDLGGGAPLGAGPLLLLLLCGLALRRRQAA